MNFRYNTRSVYHLSAISGMIGLAFIGNPVANAEAGPVHSVPAARATVRSPGDTSDLGTKGMPIGQESNSLVQLEPPDLSPLRAENATSQGALNRPQGVGVNISLPEGILSSDNSGTWSQARDGTRVWTLGISSPMAAALRVHFSQSTLPPGAQLRVGGADVENLQVYTSSDATRRDGFWTVPTQGEVVWIEYQEPASAALDSTIQIDQVSYLDFGPSGREITLAREGLKSQIELNAVSGLPECVEDVQCHPVDPVARDAVGRILYIIDNITYVCSGVLLNDTDLNTQAGYFLTARHCIDSQEAAESAIVYWFYQTDSCNGNVPTLFSLPKSHGATLLATLSETDATLLRLHDDPREGQGFAAWSTAKETGTVHGISHPQSTHKRYCMGELTTEQPICTFWPRNQYWYNDWTLGAVDWGSSGSPLFNSNWEVIGQFAGICSLVAPGCDNPADYNHAYARFDASFPGFSSFLNSVAPDDPFEDNDTISEASMLSECENVLQLVDFDDYFTFAVNSVGTLNLTTTYNIQDLDMEIELRTTGGTFLAQSQGADGVANITSNVSPGTYIVHVSKTRGWGGQYTLRFGVSGSTLFSPSTENGNVTKNRYLSMIPRNAGQSTALRVTVLSMPAGFEALNGASKWVGPPDGSGLASLQCTPTFADWGNLGSTLHVGDEVIVPGATYAIEAVNDSCVTGGTTASANPLVLFTTTRWGDIAGTWNGNQWLPPNNVVDFSDIGAIVDSFKNIPSAPPLVWCDLHGPIPNGYVDFQDILYVVEAFSGLTYPFPSPSPCP